MSDSENARRLDITLESGKFDPDRLRISKLSGTLEMSRVYSLEIEVVCLDREGIDPAELLGEDVSVVFTPSRPGEHEWSGVQRIHGMIAEIDARLGAHEDVRAYRLRIAPRTERLALNASQEIFLKATVPEIIEKKLANVGLTKDGAADVVLRLEGTYDAREFVVQYQENDLAFASRLAEHLGICFFFEHDGDADQLVLTDHPGGFHGVVAEVPFGVTDVTVRAIEAQHRIVPRNYTVHDYNYRLPQVELVGAKELAVGYAGDVVEYGAHVKTPAAASQLALVRAEEAAAGQLVYRGTSTIPALRPGLRIRVTGHPQVDDLQLLVIEVQHEAKQPVFQGDAGSYENRFRAIPADRMYRPPRRTPKPRITGLANGVIDPGVRSSGTYAILDEQGRYSVRFLFDTSPTGRAPSHPVRMLQNHAGENYGTHFPLKPGTEVLIAFIEGDPDRPVIVGAVPNPLTPSPVTAANSGIHRIKSVKGTIIDFT